MSEQAIQDSQKTIVAFVAGLLIGGLLVYVFASPAADDVMEETEDTNVEEVADNGADNNEVEVELNEESDTAPIMETGDGAIRVSDQTAGTKVVIDGATFPSDEGWIGVRDYNDGALGNILGVARFSNEQRLIPTSVELQRPTVTGNSYALVFYTESGDRVFSLADDKQNGDIVATFKAN